MTVLTRIHLASGSLEARAQEAGDGGRTSPASDVRAVGTSTVDKKSDVEQYGYVGAMRW